MPIGAPHLHAERKEEAMTGEPVLLSNAVFNPLLSERVVDLPPTGEAEPAGLRLVHGGGAW